MTQSDVRSYDAKADPSAMPTPQHFHEVLLAYCGSKALMSAVEIDLFTYLEGKRSTEQELQAALSLHPRFSKDFLDILVQLDFLELSEAGYSNSGIASTFLDRDKETFVGGFAEMTNDTFYPAWGKLTKALRTGQAQAPIPPDDEDTLFRLDVHRHPDRIRRFMTAMDSHSSRMAAVLSDLLDWSTVKTILDVGGCRGNLAGRLTLAQSHVKAICMDRPQSKPFFDEHMTALGASARIEFLGGNFFADSFPPVDVVILGHVLHDWSPDNRVILMRRAHEALKPGGKLVIYDRMTDGTHKDLKRLFYSMTFMLASGGGSEYSVTECSEWVGKAGFTSYQVHEVLEDHHVLVADR